MALQQTLVQGTVQQMILTPKMQQAIEILQLSTLELEKYIEQQLTENFVLEEEPTQSQELEIPSAPSPVPNVEVPPERDERPAGDTERDIEGELEHLMASYNDYYYEGRDLSVPDEDGKRGFIENTAAEGESMNQNLLKQLSLSTDNPTDFKIGEWIISEIDERGYFSSTVEAGAEKLGVAGGEIERILKIIHTFAPAGIGARDLRECLLIQIEASHPDNANLKSIVQDHLEQLAKKQYPKIAQPLKITVQEVPALAAIIASREPIPGRYFGNREVIYIVPDVIVKKVDNDYVVYMNDDGFPKLRISPFYRKLLKAHNDNPQTKA
ncbi:MAG: hypothetical protein HY801_02515, partial [Candidatus Lindowbacteria bacterium]|nr:hypothetical protein [Candidatus Lindowbacteria bacterium]